MWSRNRIHSFAGECPGVRAVEKIILSPTEWSWSKINWHRYMGLFLDSQFYSIDLCCYPCASTSVLITVALKLESVSPPTLLFFQDCFHSSVSLAFPYEFQDQLVDFSKDGSWNFDSGCVKSVHQFVDHVKSSNPWHGCLPIFVGPL